MLSLIHKESSLWWGSEVKSYCRMLFRSSPAHGWIIWKYSCLRPMWPRVVMYNASCVTVLNLRNRIDTFLICRTWVSTLWRRWLENFTQKREELQHLTRTQLCFEDLWFWPLEADCAHGEKYPYQRHSRLPWSWVIWRLYSVIAFWNRETFTYWKAVLRTFCFSRWTL